MNSNAPAFLDSAACDWMAPAIAERIRLAPHLHVFGFAVFAEICAPRRTSASFYLLQALRSPHLRRATERYSTNRHFNKREEALGCVSSPDRMRTPRGD
jgi:hypothetical protein